MEGSAKFRRARSQQPYKTYGLVKVPEMHENGFVVDSRKPCSGRLPGRMMRRVLTQLIMSGLVMSRLMMDRLVMSRLVMTQLVRRQRVMRQLVMNQLVYLSMCTDPPPSEDPALRTSSNRIFCGHPDSCICTGAAEVRIEVLGWGGAPPSYACPAFCGAERPPPQLFFSRRHALAATQNADGPRRPVRQCVQARGRYETSFWAGPKKQTCFIDVLINLWGPGSPPGPGGL